MLNMLGMLDFVILGTDFALGIVYDHEITQHVHCIMIMCFWEKTFVIGFFVLLVNMWYL